jgi:hypothetical protein
MVRHGKAPATTTPVDSSSSRDFSSITADTTQHSSGDQTDQAIFAGEAVQQIEALVESFRTGGAKKSETIYKIGQILADEPTSDEQLKSDSLKRYASTLDGIEAIAAQSDRHGTRLAASMLGKRKDGSGDGDRGPSEPEGNISVNDQPGDIDSFIQRLSEENNSEDRSVSDGGDSETDNSSGHESDSRSGEKGRSNKKQRVYESQMPWFKAEKRIRKSTTNRSCNKTRNILDIIQRDPTTVKRWIRCASSAPAGFPSTEWDAIIKGETINIDTVFSSLHHVHCIDESIGRVGSTEIQFGRPKPAAKVETSGQWTAAFNLATKATAFVFPHRLDELKQYADYIEELFSAKSVSIHPRLFKYDEAIRYKVGQGQNILLTDRDQFTRYYEAIVAPDGVGTGTSSSGDKGGQGKDGKPREKSDICNRFNGAKGCNSTAEKCKYRHVCKKCKQRGHGQMDCKVDEGM